MNKAQRTKLTERFEEFHNLNPDFYTSLVARTHEYLEATGNDQVGIQAVMEQARWDRAVQTKSSEFKVNNDFAAFYARLIMFQENALAGVFKLRRADAADEWMKRIGKLVPTP